MTMLKRVYTAADPIDAGLVKGLLESNGIETVVRGDLLWGGRGDLPVSDDTAPTLWVSTEDFARARALVEDYQRPEEHPEWRCMSCGESNEGQFQQCWHCGAVHTGTA